MTLIAFDTHSFVQRLTTSGMPVAQAEILAESQTALLDEKLATKKDLFQLRTELKGDMAQFKAEMKSKITKLEWMLGVIIAGVDTIAAKLFLT